MKASFIEKFVETAIKQAQIVHKAYTKERETLVKDFPYEPRIVVSSFNNK